MKTSFIVLSTITSLLLPLNSRAQTANLVQGKSAVTSNICALFSEEKEIEEHQVDAPPPVRTIADGNNSQNSINLAETELYQNLGLVKESDGSYACLAQDADNFSRKYTLFKVKKVDDVLVVSSFLAKGNFLPEQEEATTKFFLAIISFYTNIPPEYYDGIQRYLTEFYLRMADGRIPPTSDRSYPIDEPEATVVIYHPLQGVITGTAISLNIPLD